jgi:DNA repair exonuclease SbcCD ATPase subunit
MKLKKIEWRNIGPFGNKLQSVEFAESGGLWMVLGKNGHGKSFFVNLPKILYYGKLDKFKKDEIANRMNKHGWIKGEISVNPTTDVTIERKISPSDLIVHKYSPGEEPDDDNDIGKSGIANYQAYIDNEVTGLPYHIFSNIISLSVNDFKSFISMTPHDKRIIIDKLFAMEVINKMNELVKSDLRDIKINMQLFDREIVSLKNNINSAVRELAKLEEQVTKDNTVRIGEITTQLTAYKPKLKEGYAKRKEYVAKKDEITKSYNIFLQQKSKLNQEIRDIQRQIDLYDQDKCPTCETPFSEARFELIKEKLHNDIDQKKISQENLAKSEDTYSIAFGKLDDGISKINDFIIQYESAYKTLEGELNRLKAHKPQEFTSIRNIINKNSKQLQEKEGDKVKFDDDYKYLAMLEELYSDAGVKKKILESYLPTLNKEIEFTLRELHFPYALSFNSDFEPQLFQLGLEISVDTLSTGEKKRVDLAVLISIIRMLKRKYPSLNIFMLDEVLSSIDGDGIYDIIGLLQSISKEMNINIFIINHSPLPIEHFDFKIQISKNAGFSDIEVEELEREGE